MPSATNQQIKKQVVNQWLSGHSRDRIAADNHIGAGTVTNIINEWRKGIEKSEYVSVRELAINEYKLLKSELSKYHLSSEDPDKLLTVLTNLKGYRYGPKRIVEESLKSNRWSEERKHCRIIVKSSKIEYRKIDKHYRSYNEFDLWELT